MSYPPPPNGAHNPGPGGGFGPPQGFGPPEQPGPPAGGYGYPGPAPGYGYPGPAGAPGAGGPGGYGPGGPGGYGPGGPGPYPPPPGGGGGGNGGKVAAIIIAAVLVAGLIVGGVLFLADGDEGREHRADPGSTPSATPGSGESPEASSRESREPTGLPSLDIPSPDASPDVSVDPDETIEYVVLEPGTCFDHPSLSSDVTEVEELSCNGPHDAEVISNRTLTGDFATTEELQDEVLEMCRQDAEKRMKRITDGRTYYSYVLYPTLTTYRFNGKDQVSCSLTLSNRQDGTELGAPLPG